MMEFLRSGEYGRLFTLVFDKLSDGAGDADDLGDDFGIFGGWAEVSDDFDDFDLDGFEVSSGFFSGERPTSF